jgi:hypothetical protein
VTSQQAFAAPDTGEVTAAQPGRATRRFARFWMVIGVPLGLALSAVLIWQGSHSAFTATTLNSGNSFSAGTVSLTDDDSGTAMFAVTGLEPGDTGSKCIVVTYNGSLASTVNLYVATGGLTGTGLAPYLNIVIEEGAVGTFASCGAFAATATDFTGTLSAFATASTNFGTGVGAFAPTGAAQSKVYRFTYTLANNNAAQNLNSSVAFTWEASS